MNELAPQPEQALATTTPEPQVMNFAPTTTAVTAESPSNSFSLPEEPIKPMDLAVQYLQELNLPVDQASAAVSMSQKISLSPSEKASVTVLGRESSARMSNYADTILKEIKGEDEFGVQTRLNELILNAKSLNLGEIGRKSSVPLIGGLIDKFIYKTDEWKLEFQSVASKINTLLAELQKGEANILTRQKELDGLFTATAEEFKQLGVSIVAGKIKKVELAQLIQKETLLVEGNQLKAQYVSDLRALEVALDKRVSDLLALQTSAMQTMPSIRLIQHNNQLLLEKLANVRELTIPAWKHQFMLLVASQEQQKIVNLVNEVDETTNELLKSNADLLQQNTLETARVSQRSVIDLSTLEQVQQSMITTIEGVKTIYNEGVAHRQEAERAMINLQNDLRQRLSNPNNL